MGDLENKIWQPHKIFQKMTKQKPHVPTIAGLLLEGRFPFHVMPYLQWTDVQEDR